MNNPNPETPPEDTPAVAPVVVAPPPTDNRRRLRELLSIAERDRSDEQWDEIIELEIQLAPGNRISGNEHNDSPVRGGSQSHGKQGNSGANGGGGGGGGVGQQQKKHRPRANNPNNRRPRQNKPPTGGTPA